SHQRDLIVLLAREDQSCIHISGIHEMGFGKQRTLSERLMDGFGVFDIGFGCIGSQNMGDEMRKIFLARFTKMHLVAVPAEIALVAVMSLMIVRRTNGEVSRRQVILVAYLDLALLVPEKLLDPGASQSLHLWELAQWCRRVLIPDLREQAGAVLTDLLHDLLLFLLRPWYSPFLNAAGVAFKPVSWHPGL